jgi:RNA polymerase sigma-70 factor, ECF subfamily
MQSHLEDRLRMADLMTGWIHRDSSEWDQRRRAMPIEIVDGAAHLNDLNYQRTAERGVGQLLSDDHLLAAAKSNDSLAFGELFNRHKRRMFRLARRILQNREDAEDVVQEAFLLAFIHLRDFQGGARFSTWLSRITINAALMKLRKKTRRVEISIDEDSESGDFSFRHALTDSSPNPEEDCMRQEASGVLREALAELQPNARRVLELYELEGRSMKEIADNMGISMPAVKSRMFRARPKMRNKLYRCFSKREERKADSL